MASNTSLLTKLNCAFQTTKGLHYVVYSMYGPIFKSFLQAVYPVAVTKDCYRIFQKLLIATLFFIRYVRNLDCKCAILRSYCSPNLKKRLKHA